MKIARETTQWPDMTPNHIYVFTDSMNQIIAYVPEGTNNVHRFKTPIEIDRRGRKFEFLEDEPDQRVVIGSKGEKYHLTEVDGTWICTCPGFQFHGRCKHQNMVK